MDAENTERQIANCAAETHIQRLFARSVAGFDAGPALVLTYNDADGSLAGAILFKALERVRVQA